MVNRLIDHEYRVSAPALPQLSQEGRIIEGDFLKLPAEELIPVGRIRLFVVIGNYPYNISSQIFFRILELRERIPAVAGAAGAEWRSDCVPRLEGVTTAS